MPPPSAPHPDEPRTPPGYEPAAGPPAGVVEAWFLGISLFLVLAVAGLVPGVVWALLGVVAAMVLVPWGMLRAFEFVERRGGGPPPSP